MRTFIQLRNSVGYAIVITPEGEPDHSVTPDHTTAVEVFTENPDQFLNKKYNEETSTDPWTAAAVLNIERDPRIKVVVLGAVSKRGELVDGFIRHGWVMHAAYNNAQYGSSVIIMKKIPG